MALNAVSNIPIFFYEINTYETKIKRREMLNPKPFKPCTYPWGVKNVKAYTMKFEASPCRTLKKGPR